MYSAAARNFFIDIRCWEVREVSRLGAECCLKENWFFFLAWLKVILGRVISIISEAGWIHYVLWCRQRLYSFIPCRPKPYLVCVIFNRVGRVKGFDWWFGRPREIIRNRVNNDVNIVDCISPDIAYVRLITEIASATPRFPIRKVIISVAKRAALRLSNPPLLPLNNWSFENSAKKFASQLHSISFTAAPPEPDARSIIVLICLSNVMCIPNVLLAMP